MAKGTIREDDTVVYPPPRRETYSWWDSEADFSTYLFAASIIGWAIVLGLVVVGII